MDRDIASIHRRAALAAIPLLCFAASAQALDWRATPLYSTVNLNSGFQPDPYEFSLTAGGDRNASEAGPNCSGYVNGSPDLDINYQSGNYPLTIAVDSDADTTLVVFDAAGNWHCNDDYSSASGTNPAIKWHNPPSGNYNVWVGTYSPEAFPTANVRVTEGDGLWSSGGGGRAVASSHGIEWGDDTSQWSHDQECDDPRFAGPGVHSTNLDQDRYHDASDCRSLYEQGRIYLK